MNKHYTLFICESDIYFRLRIDDYESLLNFFRAKKKKKKDFVIYGVRLRLG